MSGTPTIVLASLSDDKLKESINSLVKHVNDKMEEMVESTNSAVKRMEAKLKSLGNLKIDSGGSNDGGTGRRTQQYEKLTKAVNDASEAVSKETQKLQDLQQSLSGASDREQNFISQKERAANTIAQENELLQRQEQELTNLKNQLSSFSGTNQQTTASIDEQIAKKRKAIADLYYELEKAEGRKRILSKQKNIEDQDFHTERMKARENEILAIKQKITAQEKELAEAQKRLTEARQAGSQAATKATQDEKNLSDVKSQIAAKEKEIAETKGRIATAAREQTEAERNASQAAKEKANIQSQVTNQEKQVAEAKKQLTTATRQQTEVEKQSVQNIAQQTAAREKQIKKNQEVAASFDQMAKAQQVAIRSASPSGIRNADTLQTMNIQLDLLRERLREARQQYSSFVALAAHATTTGDKGLFQYATDGVHRYEQEVRSLIPQIRGLQDGIQQMGNVLAPQGHTIQNYVNSLQKANPELAALNEQFKKGQSALQQQNTEQQKSISYTEEELKKIQTLQDRLQQLKNERKELSRAMQDAGWDRFGAKIQLGAYPDDTNLKNKLIDAENRYAVAKQKIAQVDKEIVSIESEMNGVRSRFAASTQQSAQAQRNLTNETNQQKQTLDDMNAYIRQNIQREQERRDTIRQTGLAAQQSYRGIVQSAREQLEINTGEPIKGVKELGQAIIEMRRAYYDMSDAERLSPIGQSLFNDIKKAEELRKNLDAFNRNITGISFRGSKDFVDVDKSIGSYANLSKLLKELTSEYQKLGRADRNAAKGNELADKIQRIGREAQKVQQQMNRPISFAAAMKGDEKTLDDIAYKMRRLQSYRQGIDLTKPNAANEIKQVDEALAKLQKDADKWMNKSQQMIKSNTALGRSWNYMKNRLAFYFTVGAGTQFIKNLIEVRSQYEMNERALGILIDSAERGTQIFNELSQMALVSPYTLIELSSAAKQLTAYDVAAKDVVDTTRRLADMAAAVGIPIERLTYALGQIKAYGYLNSRDARMFANAGIPLVKQLSDYYTQLEGRLVSTADVYDRIKKKTIDYEQVVQVINNMTDEGGKFFDFQAKMADTLKVRLANLTLAWNNMLNDIGSSNQGVLTSGIGALRDMFLHWKDIESIINKVAVAFGIYKTAQLVSLVWTGRITTAMGVQELVGKKLQARLASLTATQGGFLSAATTGWAALAFVVADVFLTISRNAEEIERLNKTIADGAKESYESLDKMLHSSEMVSTRLSALQGKLSDTDAAKAWEMLREQIEISSASSKELIAELMKQPDLNKRVTESFNLAEKIEEANRKLSDLSDNLDVTQNSILFGLFGEGLAEDIDDYNERIKYTAEVAEWSAKKNKGFWENAAMGLSAIFNEVKDAFGSDSEEAQNEIKNFSKKAAQTIKDELGEEGIKDKIQVNEAIARVVRGMEQQFPQIRGKGKVLFETIFYDTMATEFKGAVDSQAYYYEKFLEQLKKDHASAFSGVTEDIKKETFKWSSAQIDAIQKTADKVKKDLPAASQKAIDDILTQLNTTDFKVRIVAEMATTSLDNVQKQFREKFIEKPWIADDKEREKAENEANQRYGTLMRKNTESNAEYEKRISDERKKQLELSQKNADIITKNKGKQEEFSKAVLADAQKQKEAADDWLKAAKDIEDKGGYDFSTKSENAAARKAAKQAESELQKALKDELSTIEKVRSIYKDLTKEGMSHADAVERATRGWGETVNAINKVLRKNGLQKLDLSKFAGIENPRELVNMLQSQLNTLLKRGAKPAEIKELQTKVNTLEVDADKYDLTKITKGLNNELGKLKEEYELAVELDANPEMGGMFADWMGIDISELPHTAEEYAKRMTKALNKYLAEEKSGIEIGNILALTDDDLRMFQQRVDNQELNQVWVDTIVKNTKEARAVLKKENSEIAKDWDNIVQKYAEYEYKIEQVQRNTNKERRAFALKYGTQEQKERALVLTTEIDAEKDQEKKQELIQQLKQLLDEITGNDDARLKIKVAIDNKGLEESARVSFEEFQKSPDWIVATGDLAGMTDKAIGMLIESIEKYKVTAKNLSPKQIKQLNRALVELYKKQREGNPFKALSTAMMEAKNRVSVYEDELKETQDELDELTKKQAKSFSAERAKDIDAHIKKIKELKKKIEEGAELKATNVVEGLQGMVSTANAVSSAVGDMWEAFGGSKEVTEQINGVFTVLDSTLEKAQLGAQIGGKWGAIAGAVVGLFTGLGQVFGGGKDDITLAIERSERSVKQLEIAYKRLEVTIEEAYGAAKWGAEQAAIANKKLQLAELKRQLALERSRDSKDRDEGKINDLMGQIEDLKIEIEKSIKDITNDLLGISSVGNAAEELVSSMIDAFRKGEDYMLHYDQTFEDMINNMVMKSIVGRVIGDRLQSLWDRVDAVAKEKGEPYQKQIDALMAAKKQNEDSMETLNNSFLWGAGVDKAYFDKYGITLTDKLKQNNERIDEEIKKLQKQYSDAIAPTPEDVQSVRDDAANWRDSVKSEFEAYMELFGIKFGDSADGKQLSSLQQGISQITEVTAQSLEAYANSISQQAYLRNDLLTQIRDAVIGMDMDVQVATQAQMLLQLQQSYQVQMSIESILQGVLTPSGRAFSVELLS